MNAFALDKNYNQFNFEEISVDELEVISGGSGGSVARCVMGTAGGAILGGLAGAGTGSVVPVLGTFWGGVVGVVGGALTGAAASCFG